MICKHCKQLIQRDEFEWRDVSWGDANCSVSPGSFHEPAEPPPVNEHSQLLDQPTVDRLDEALKRAATVQQEPLSAGTNVGIPVFPVSMESYRELCAELYQVCGVLWAENLIPRLVLDKLSAGQRGLPIPQDSLLPFDLPSPAAPRTQGSEPECPIAYCKCERPHEGARPVGTPRFCERCKLVIRAAQPQPAPRPPVCPKCGLEIDSECWETGDYNVVCSNLHAFPATRVSDFAQFFAANPAQKEEE